MSSSRKRPQRQLPTLNLKVTGSIPVRPIGAKPCFSGVFSWLEVQNGRISQENGTLLVARAPSSAPTPYQSIDPRPRGSSRPASATVGPGLAF
jgi:hypothetical protein